MVIVSHYFGELPSGVGAVRFGWMAVGGFFVLSGFLIGRLILERKDRANFFVVFYARRACRILPPYVITLVVCLTLLGIITADWRDVVVDLPAWTYFAFVQNFAMAQVNHYGPHWLGPTWTLAVEEHFYLVAPAMLVFTPRRWLVQVLVGCCIGALAMRTAVFGFGVFPEAAGLCLIFSLADTLAIGILTAVLFQEGRIDAQRWSPQLALAPSICIGAIWALSRGDVVVYNILRPLLLALAAASFILCVMGGLPIAERMKSTTLQFFGNNGYCLYLTHLPVLGLMHGLILGAKPDLATPQQWAVTLVTLPLCVLVGWGMTKLVEEPSMAFARRYAWSPNLRPDLNPG
jgi:peptidoglycan/LPS O-acetylase OafA/YrhL